MSTLRPPDLPGTLNFSERLPGRFILSLYRIIFILALLCGIVAAALGVVGQTGPSAWVAIAGSGITAIM